MTEGELLAVLSALENGVPASELRAQFPGCHFTECHEDDIAPQYRPAGETSDLRIFLVTGQSGHCLSLTNELSAATGLVLATRGEED